MEIEELNKSQIILLTLLVSFVTSIATGIVTVSLMQQAPPAITQTVNRVIEHTVERLVPSGQTAAATVTTEKTVVVKESDLISQAVARVSPSIVQLYSSDAANSAFLGLGTVLDSTGKIIADADSLGSAGDATILLPDGTSARAFVTSRDAVTGIAFLQATSTNASSTPVWKPAVIADGKLVLGQTLIGLSGKSIPRIADGIITAFVPLADAGAADVFDTNVPSGSLMDGSPVVNTDGAVIGVSTGISRATSASSFVSLAVIMKSSAKSAKESTP